MNRLQTMVSAVGRILIATSLVFTLSAVSAQDMSRTVGDSADVREITGILGEWIDGYNERSPEAVAALYEEHAYYLTQHYITGIVQGRPAIQAYVKKGTDAGYHIDSITIQHLEVHGNTAWIIDRYFSTNQGVKAAGVNLVVLERIGGRWMIVAHEAAVPDPEQAIRHLDVPK